MKCQCNGFERAQDCCGLALCRNTTNAPGISSTCGCLPGFRFARKLFNKLLHAVELCSAWVNTGQYPAPNSVSVAAKNRASMYYPYCCAAVLLRVLKHPAIHSPSHLRMGYNRPPGSVCPRVPLGEISSGADDAPPSPRYLSPWRQGEHQQYE